MCIVQVRRVSDVAGIKHAEVLDFLIMIPLYGEERKALPPGRTPEVWWQFDPRAATHTYPCSLSKVRHLKLPWRNTLFLRSDSPRCYLADAACSCMKWVSAQVQQPYHHHVMFGHVLPFVTNLVLRGTAEQPRGRGGRDARGQGAGGQGRAPQEGHQHPGRGPQGGHPAGGHSAMQIRGAPYKRHTLRTGGTERSLSQFSYTCPCLWSPALSVSCGPTSLFAMLSFCGMGVLSNTL